MTDETLSKLRRILKIVTLLKNVGTDLTIYTYVEDGDIGLIVKINQDPNRFNELDRLMKFVEGNSFNHYYLKLDNLEDYSELSLIHESLIVDDI